MPVTMLEKREKPFVNEVKLKACLDTAYDVHAKLHEAVQFLKEGKRGHAEAFAAVAVQLLQSDNEICRNGIHPEDGFEIREIVWLYPEGSSWEQRTKALITALEQSFNLDPS